MTVATAKDKIQKMEDVEQTLTNIWNTVNLEHWQKKAVELSIEFLHDYQRILTNAIDMAELQGVQI